MNTAHSNKVYVRRVSVCVLSIAALAFGSAHAGDNVSSSPVQNGRMSFLDMRNAKALPLPQADSAIINSVAESVPVEYAGEPAFVPGKKGNGRKTPVRIPLPLKEEENSEEFSSQEYGTGNAPFNTSRVDLGGMQNVSKLYPYSAIGRLYFKIGTSSYVCSASLIKKGLVVTAGHCVADWGKNTYHTSFQYIPALYGTTAPYGVWNGVKAYAMSTYLSGTGTCAQAGVICNDDVAVVVLAPQNSTYPGTQTGWLGYGTNGFGFTGADPSVANGNIALIKQAGYPVSHDSGVKMQETDSQGVTTSTLANNTVWGSRQTGGSSGGPEIVNFGELAVLSSPATIGSEADRNMIVGVTSWGYTDAAIKKQGASPFLSGTNGNIDKLVNAACTAYPAACAN